MRRVWPPSRGTTVAQPLHAMWKAAAGSIQPGTSRTVFDETESEGASAGPVALPRSSARRRRCERDHLGRRLYAARARVAARRVARNERALHQGRGAESDAKFQGAWHDGGRFDGQRVGRAETSGAVSG